MKKLENKTLQLFIDNLVDAFKYENDDSTRENKIDIPFVISSLYESFEKEPYKYDKFIRDLNSYDYNISVIDSKNDYNGIVDVDIYLIHNYSDCDWYYEISFDFDERYWGYCECTPDMPDYREDKGCCGHGCDADFSSFRLKKVTTIAMHTWDGDEHDYWEFEDDFYASDDEFRKKKEKEDKEHRINELKQLINIYNAEIQSLMG